MNMDVPEDACDQRTVSIPNDSYVLRRVHKNDVDLTQPVPILPRAFRPSSEDTDGLSVYQDEAHGGPSPSAVAAAGRSGAECYVVVRLSVGELREIGLDVIAKQIPDDLPGQAVIPELNVTDYQASKQSKRVQKALQMKLSELAGDAIVYPPNFYGVSH